MPKCGALQSIRAAARALASRRWYLTVPDENGKWVELHVANPLVVRDDRDGLEQEQDGASNVRITSHCRYVNNFCSGLMSGLPVTRSGSVSLRLQFRVSKYSSLESPRHSRNLHICHNVLIVKRLGTWRKPSFLLKIRRR